MMKRIYLLFFLCIGLNTGYAQYTANFNALIRKTDGGKYTGKFITVNDSLLILYGFPDKINNKFIAMGKFEYINFKAGEVNRIKIYRRGIQTPSILIGTIGGVVAGFSIAALAGDDISLETVLWLGIIGGPLVGSMAGLAIGDAIATKIKLKDLELSDFSEIKSKLLPFQALKSK